MPRLKLLVSLVLAFVAGLATSASSQDLTTLTPPYAKVFFQSSPSSLTRWVAGQTFDALNSSLTSFGFYGERFIDPSREVSAGTMFQAELWAWDGAAITGSRLFASNPFAHWTAAGWFDFQVGSLPLTAGASYAALLRELDGNSNDAGAWLLGGQFALGTFSDGNLLRGLTYEQNGFDVLVDVPQMWIYFDGTDPDLAFRASFAPGAGETVPEPTTLALVLTGLAGTLTGRRRMVGGQRVGPTA